jgi:hypothetical protein
MFLQSFCLVATLLAAQVETTFTVEYGGKKYEFRISEQALQNTPVWTPDQDNPPLSARSAIDIAKNEMAALLPNGKDWRLYEVTLRPLDDHWVYLVQFLEPLRPDGGGQQLSNGFQVVVLMNGVAVMPRISG